MAADLHPELIERYGGNAPRYTSYPTAVQFHAKVKDADYLAAAAAAQARGPLSIYVHVPFCRSPCYYCACNRVITRRVDTGVEYATRLIRETALRAQCFGTGRSVAQLHFGGGTPTYLSTGILAQVMRALGAEFSLTDDPARDYSIEIDPRTLAPDTLAELADLGFNRLSLGVQDFDPAVQGLINRMQSEELVAEALAEARRLRYASVNFDLIYGLPGQSAASFRRTLELVIGMRPDRIAMYGYAHMPGLFKAQARFPQQVLPDAALRLELLMLGIERLSAAGYVHIGMDHFALPEDSLAQARRDGSLHRSFQGYTTHREADLVNLGASAIGRVGNLFVQNVKGLHDYERAVDEGRRPLWRGLELTREDRIRADVIQQIMCRRHVAVEGVEARWGIEFARHFAPEIAKLRALEADRLLTLGHGEIMIRPSGEYLLRNIAAVFDAYVAGAGPARASKAI